MSFNPLDATKNFFNQSTDVMSKTYDKVSSDVVNLITPIVQTVKPDIVSSRPVQPVQPVKIIEPNEPLIKLVPFEKQYESQFVGCYADDPVNPSMNTYLGKIRNISECIDMGKNKDFKYIGIRGGNECWASNNVPSTQSVDRFKFCNVGCDEIGTGNCGGFYYNQVYKTMGPTRTNKGNFSSEQELEKTISNPISNEISEPVINVLENFISADNDLKKISIGLGNDNFNYWKPINMYEIFFWLVILLFLIYLLFEYLYKKNNEKLI
jgi:hypothetical protein